MARTVILGRRPRTEGAAAENTPTNTEIVAALARVAEDHRPEGGYGDTLWRASDRTVLWIPADWTETADADAAEAAFAAVPGVEHVEIGDAEMAIPDGPEWEIVWAEGAQGVEHVNADVDGLVAEYRDLAYVDLAVQQVQAELDSRQRDPVDAAALLAAVSDLPEIPGLDTETLTAALAALERSHRATVDGAVALVASAVRARGGTNSDQLALHAIDALRAIASRPDPDPPHVTVNVPEQNVTMPAPVVNVTVPDHPAPVVNVAAAEAPVVNVTVPEQPVPVVNVTTPETHIDVHMPPHEPSTPIPAAAVATPERPSRIRVEFDADGSKMFVPEYDQPPPAGEGDDAV